ncbi:MAG TPA: deoxyribonuclease IV, partial [Candidatus Binatus sp.]|nr:deoxyribonuclease IV [Candidatus Binatus sp.]
ARGPNGKQVGFLGLKVGMHVSIAGTIDLAVDRAVKSHCDTFQVFTRNPRGWRVAPLEPEEIESFKTKQREAKIGPVISHMPYLPNLSSPKDDFYEKSVEALTGEVDRCTILGIQYIVIHLGSHLGLGREAGLARLVAALNLATPRIKGNLKILLENTAGQTNSMGSKFEELKEIIKLADHPRRLGVCLDSCHLYAAGYDLHTLNSVNKTFRSFDDVVGLERLKVVHLNDSKNGLGSGLDRHEHIGMGYIGEEGFRAILRHPAVRELPLILETPIDERRDDQGNLEMVRKLGN